MKWISCIYLFISTIILGLMAYSFLGNMLDYSLEDASYYRSVLLRHIEYFLLYLIVNIVYIIINRL